MRMIDSATERPPEPPAAPARGPIEHKVKSWRQFFEATLSGAKAYEVRRLTERDYRVGDSLLLQEYDPTTKTYSGRELAVRITYITSAEAPCALSEECLHPDFCILSIVKV
jgi:Domain of unknown function (DUF3850)